MEANGMLECKVKYLSLSADTWDILGHLGHLCSPTTTSPPLRQAAFRMRMPLLNSEKRWLPHPQA